MLGDAIAPKNSDKMNGKKEQTKIKTLEYVQNGKKIEGDLGVQDPIQFDAKALCRKITFRTTVRKNQKKNISLYLQGGF